MNKSFEVIVAATTEGGIGKDGDLPWKIPSDLKRFAQLTKSTFIDEKHIVNACIMGRKTYWSIPPKFRPLVDRVNVVISGNPDTKEVLPAEMVATSFEEALQLIHPLAQSEYNSCIDKIFIIGGSSVYAEAMKSPLCSKIHLTRVLTPFECDTFIPEIDDSIYELDDDQTQTEKHVENGIEYCYLTYKRRTM